VAHESNPSSSPRAAGSARWLLVVVLAVVAGALLVELGRTATATGQGLGDILTSGGGVLLVPSPLARDSYGVYLVDPQQGKLCLYEYQAGRRQLRLLAVRNFVYDLRLDEYNTQPSPTEMRQLAEQVAPAGAPAEAPATQEAPKEAPAGFPVERTPAEE
jgi:hypothetical protein